MHPIQEITQDKTACCTVGSVIHPSSAALNLMANHALYFACVPVKSSGRNRNSRTWSSGNDKEKLSSCVYKAFRTNSFWHIPLAILNRHHF